MKNFLLIFVIFQIFSIIMVSTESPESLYLRPRRSGILFGKLARNWVTDDKRIVLRPLTDTFQNSDFYYR
ncbi:unnamed protein product [Caenorhabditis angaria]|uniref:Uncharacterized protein n=1 Tax=Caenorhabditis angaria TaxID=860376 RepID=A0A9P1ISE6_9PELO|nr:unnamed protein product [Caenorhabditis angaria]